MLLTGSRFFDRSAVENQHITQFEGRSLCAQLSATLYAGSNIGNTSTYELSFLKVEHQLFVQWSASSAPLSGFTAFLI